MYLDKLLFIRIPNRCDDVSGEVVLLQLWYIGSVKMIDSVVCGLEGFF